MDSANFEEVITCGICLESFNEDSRCPRILTCGHSLCHSCLEKLIAQSPCCPTCKIRIQFNTAKSIPVNYAIKSLLNIKVQTGVPPTNSRKFLSEGFCSEHDNYKEMRCMDCELWICGLCIMLYHKNCRTLLVAEAYIELKNKVFQKVDRELGKRKAIRERLTESLRVLDEERKFLVEEIKKKGLELKDREKRLEELESLKSEEQKFCDKLKRLKEMAKSSVNDAEFSKTINELDKLLEEGKNQIPKVFQNFPLPQTNTELGTLCQNGPVYAVEDRYAGTRYGKIRVKDGKIWVHHFQVEKPVGKLFVFKDILSRFSDSTELPKTVFLQLDQTSDEDPGKVVIETEGHSPRAKNFILLCSGLKRLSYKGLEVDYCGKSTYYQLYPGPPPVVLGLRDDDPGSPVKEADVYGMSRRKSWFQIQLKDDPSYSVHKFGVVVAGLHILKYLQRSFKLTECGLII